MAVCSTVRCCVGVSLACWLVASAAAANAPKITEFSAGAVAAGPSTIVAGADGNLWFSKVIQRLGPHPEGATIGKISTSGVVKGQYKVGPFDDNLGEVAAGPDGNIWFTESFYPTQGSLTNGTAPGGVGMITPDGAVTQFSAGISPGSRPGDITAGPDGNLWFTEFSGNRIGMVTPAGVVTEFSAGIAPQSHPAGIAAGPDGRLWFTQTDEIGSITPSGVVTEHRLPSGIDPDAITAGPDRKLWFTWSSKRGGGIGRITPAGVVTEYSAGITPGSRPAQITAGPDGNLWFTEAAGNRIGRITTAGAVTEYGVGITPKSGPNGIVTGPDGNIWFTEPGLLSSASPTAGSANRIGRLVVPRRR